MATTGGSILFVCRANVCRSPVAEFVASDRLASLGLEVLSAGTDATADHEICSRAGDFIADQDRDRTFSGAHRSTRLTPKLTSYADLVVTASIRERSIVARLDPDARERTFTLVEFDRLLSILPTVSGTTTLPSVVAQAHQLRWRATSEHWPESAMLRRLNPQRARDGLSLRDPHAARTSVHAPVLTETRARVGAISDSLLVRLSGAVDAEAQATTDAALPGDDSRRAV